MKAKVILRSFDLISGLGRMYDGMDLENGPIAAYQSLIEKELLRKDEYQSSLVKKLDELHQRINGYQPSKAGFFGKVGVLEQFQ